MEAEAKALGVRRLILETGLREHAALALYRAAGFQQIPLYGEYLLSPDTSVCLGKVPSPNVERANRIRIIERVNDPNDPNVIPPQAAWLPA